MTLFGAFGDANRAETKAGPEAVLADLFDCGYTFLIVPYPFEMKKYEEKTGHPPNTPNTEPF